MSIAPAFRSRTSDTEDGVFYPSEDGKPLGETGWHATSAINLIQVLRDHLAGRDAYIAGNMFLYYEQHNPKAVRCPDCMVILGVPREPERRSFKVWNEGAVPSVVFEFSSEDTLKEDLGPKRETYARLGIPEYFLFDPIGECLTPRFRGLRLREGVYEELVPDADGGFVSEELNLRLVPEGPLIRLIDLATGQPLLTSEEKTEALQVGARLREDERIRAENERIRADYEHGRAEAERAEAAAERAKAEAERDRRGRTGQGREPGSRGPTPRALLGPAAEDAS